MPFKKGHKGMGGGRPKGSKTGESNKQRLIRYSPKHWDKTNKSMYDIEEITYRLENNLPLDDYLDTFEGKYERKNDDENM